MSDARVVLDELASVVDDGQNEVFELRSGAAVRDFAAAEAPDLVITDCQVQNMGGIAICHDLKLEESGGRLPPTPVLIILDRRA
ncbi:MAG: response regulator, partial [Thermoplasmata archaeon]|nr:response regulator [Thermoplasmata archaeon]